MKDNEAGTDPRRRVDEANKTLDQEFHGLGGGTVLFYPELLDDGDADGMAAERARSHGGQLLPNSEFGTLNYHPSTIPTIIYRMHGLLTPMENDFQPEI